MQKGKVNNAMNSCIRCYVDMCFQFSATYIYIYVCVKLLGYIPDGTRGKEPICQCRRPKRPGLIPESGDPLEWGMATHFSILAWRISMDKGAWWITVHRGAQSRTQLKQLSMHTY